MSWISPILKVLDKAGFLSTTPSEELTTYWKKMNKTNIISETTNLEGEKEGATKVTIKRRTTKGKQEKWIFLVVAGIDCGREYIGTTKEIGVGRHPENLILLRDPKVSRFHAVFHHKGTKLVLEDLGSTNGTRINDQIICKKTPVYPGDQLKFGETVILVKLEME